MEYRDFRDAVQEDSDGKLTGLLAPFGAETTIGRMEKGGWREEIAPGAFSKALREGDTLLLLDHDVHLPLARRSAGTLRLQETAKGLEFDADPVDTSYARDMRANIKHGNKRGCSIGFESVKDEWFDDQGRPSDRFNGTRRVLREVKLPEGSIVTNPAYKGTTVAYRDELLAQREERASEAAAERAAASIDVEVLQDMLDVEGRASSISADERKRLAAKGQALKDGSYPIPDKSHLHAAAVLAASGHGNVEAAKRLIRKRAKELGVDVNSLPGFGKESDSREEGRDDPDGKEYAAIDKAIRALEGDEPDVKGALSVLRANKAQRSEQEPETSTPEQDDELALHMAMRSREIELELL